MKRTICLIEQLPFGRVWMNIDVTIIFKITKWLLLDRIVQERTEIHYSKICSLSTNISWRILLNINIFISFSAGLFHSISLSFKDLKLEKFEHLEWNEELLTYCRLNFPYKCSTETIFQLCQRGADIIRDIKSLLRLRTSTCIRVYLQLLAVSIRQTSERRARTRIFHSDSRFFYCRIAEKKRLAARQPPRFWSTGRIC